jgi:plasmid stabilization system protein ParE
MKYTVVWHRTAEAKLADIWNQASDRQAVSDAANAIDRILCYSPESRGRPLHRDRVFIQKPLAVIFSVFPEKGRVEILQVWRW